MHILTFCSNRRVILASVFSLLMLSEMAEAQSSDSLQWSITPYIWASNTTLDLSYRWQTSAEPDTVRLPVQAGRIQGWRPQNRVQLSRSDGWLQFQVLNS